MWRMYDSSTGAMLFNSADTAGLHGNHTAEIFRMVFLSTSAALVSVSSDGTARVWNAVSGAVTHVLHHAGHPKLCRCILSPDDKELWVGSGTGALFVWDLSSVMGVPSPAEACGVPVATLNIRKQADCIRGLSMSRDGTIVCACFENAGVAFVLDRARREVLHSFSFKDCALHGNGCFFGASNRYLLLGDGSKVAAFGTLHVKDLSTITAAKDSDVASVTFPFELTHVLVSSDGRRIIVSSYGGMYVLDVGEGGVSALPSSFSVTAMSIRCSPTMINVLRLH
jgi:WD40 repeat protein